MSSTGHLMQRTDITRHINRHAHATVGAYTTTASTLISRHSTNRTPPFVTCAECLITPPKKLTQKRKMTTSPAVARATAHGTVSTYTPSACGRCAQRFAGKRRAAGVVRLAPYSAIHNNSWIDSTPSGAVLSTPLLTLYTCTCLNTLIVLCQHSPVHCTVRTMCHRRIGRGGPSAGQYTTWCATTGPSQRLAQRPSHGADALLASCSAYSRRTMC